MLHRLWQHHYLLTQTYLTTDGENEANHLLKFKKKIMTSEMGQ